MRLSLVHAVMKSVPLMALLLGAISLPAFAGEGLFSRVYTTETVPQGHWELEELVRDRTGRAFGAYNAMDFKTEAEYGITDNLQVSLYLNSGTMNARNAPDDDDPNGATGFSRKRAYFQSVSAEFIYRVLSPVKDPIGLAFYLEPEVDFYDLHNGLQYGGSYEGEFRVLLQKNFMEDQVILVYNLGLEAETIRFKGDSDRNSELDFNNEIGVTYRVAPNWYVGLEGRNHNEIGNFHHHEHSVYWAGPAVHYANQHFWTTLGVLRQVYGVPNGVDPDNGAYIGDDLFLRSHEKWEITFKLGFPF